MSNEVVTQGFSLDHKVKDANRQFYDAVAHVYEDVDGRRNDELRGWLSNTMKELSNMTSGGVLLDLGCGSGVVMRSGKQYFRHIYGMDISPNILKLVRKESGNAICGEGAFIPLKDNSVDVVVCFSVLHHIYDHEPLFKEIYRVLKDGGILYIDHDMDKSFMKRSYLSMKLYRYIFDTGKRYLKASQEITREIYKLSEIHADGIDSGKILNQLKDIGFNDIKWQYHWFGLNGILNTLIGHKRFKRGLAPLFSVSARK